MIYKRRRRRNKSVFGVQLHMLVSFRQMKPKYQLRNNQSKLYYENTTFENKKIKRCQILISAQAHTLGLSVLL